jgi:hypothetical protein
VAVAPPVWSTAALWRRWVALDDLFELFALPLLPPIGAAGADFPP